MKILLVVALALMVAVPCFAEAQITPKIACTYNIDSEQIGEAIGGSIKEDLFGIKGLDTDVLIASEEVGDTFSDDNKTLINGVSYNYDLDKFAIGIGVGVSTITYIDNDIEVSNVDKYVYALGSYKF